MTCPNQHNIATTTTVANIIVIIIIFMHWGKLDEWNVCWKFIWPDMCHSWQWANGSTTNCFFYVRCYLFRRVPSILFRLYCCRQQELVRYFSVIYKVNVTIRNSLFLWSTTFVVVAIVVDVFAIFLAQRDFEQHVHKLCAQFIQFIFRFERFFFRLRECVCVFSLFFCSRCFFSIHFEEIHCNGHDSKTTSSSATHSVFFSPFENITFSGK